MIPVLLLSAMAFTAVAEDTFVVQILEPLGGKVEKPADWYYAERHRSKDSLNWVISKEKSEDGYATGVSIQLMIGIEEKTGKLAERFVDEVVQSQIAKAKKSTLCEKEEAGFFMRQCLTTEEQQVKGDQVTDYRVLYSFFWNNEIDMLGITVAGTPIDSWDEYKNTFQRMSEIEIINMDRFRDESSHDKPIN